MPDRPQPFRGDGRYLASVKENIMYRITASNRLASIAEMIAAQEARMIGFDRHWQMLEDLNNSLGARSTYPPYNLRSVAEDRYQVELAVAGFNRDQVTVTVNDNRLVVEGNQDDDTTTDSFLHRGIAKRRFRQSFALAEFVEVTGAELRDGILRIELARIVPDDKKPRVIELK
jgi:molecular chaperone IbpA